MFCIKYSNCTYLQQQVNLTLVRYCQYCTALWWGCAEFHLGTICQCAHGMLIFAHNTCSVIRTHHVSWNNSNGEITQLSAVPRQKIQLKHIDLFYDIINLYHIGTGTSILDFTAVMDCMSASYILLMAILNERGSNIHSYWNWGEWWVCTNENKCHVQTTNIKFLRGIKRCTLHDLIQNKNTTQDSTYSWI